MKADKIGSIIKDLLKDVRVINGYYPLEAPERTALPFVLYRRVSVTPTYSKRCSARSEFDTIRIDVAVYSNTYEGSVEVMSDVHDAIQGKSGIYGDIEAKPFMMVDSSEDFENGVFMQIHTYELIIY